MCVLSNTSTMNGMIDIWKRALSLAVSVLAAIAAMAQGEINMLPLERTSYHPLNLDIYAYGLCSWKEGENAKIHTAPNTFGNTSYQRPINRQFINAGIGFDFYRNLHHHFLIDTGYEFAHLGYSKLPFADTGVYTHWLNVDARYSYLCFEGGVKTSTYLAGSERCNSPIDMTGITPYCYNRFAIAPYGGLALTLQKMKFEARLGYYLIPKLDPDRTADYNLTKVKISRMYIEFGLSVRLFSTRKLYKSKNTILEKSFN